MILCAVKIRVLIRARRVQQLAAEHRQMGDVVDPAQVIGRKIGLKMVAAQLLEIVREDNFVTVHKIRARALYRPYNVIQGIGVNHIVVVQQRQIFAGGSRKPFSGVGGNATVFDFAVDKAGVLLRQRRRLGGNLRVGGIAGIHHHQLPVGVGLLAHAAGHLLKIARRGVVQRHHNADAGSLQVFGALGFQLAFQGDIGVVLPKILVHRQPHAKAHIAPHLLGALLAQDGCGAPHHAAQVRGVCQAPRHF